MEPGSSMTHSQVIPILSQINQTPRINTYFLGIHLILSSHLLLDLPKGIFPAGIFPAGAPVKILKALLPSSILAT